MDDGTNDEKGRGDDDERTTAARRAGHEWTTAERGRPGPDVETGPGDVQRARRKWNENGRETGPENTNKKQ